MGCYHTHMRMACACTSGMRVCNGHGHGLHVCVRAMCELRLCGGAAACVWRNVVAPIAFHTRSMSTRHVPPQCARASVPWRLKTLTPSILRLHAPRRAPSSPESSPWSATEQPGRQRLLGACLAGFFAGALLTLLRRTQRRGVGAGVRPKPREADAPQRAHAGMQALHGASATRCRSGGCRRGGATHAAVDQRERALILSAEMAVNSECVPRADEVLGQWSRTVSAHEAKLRPNPQ